MGTPAPRPQPWFPFLETWLQTTGGSVTRNDAPKGVSLHSSQPPRPALRLPVWRGTEGPGRSGRLPRAAFPDEELGLPVTVHGLSPHRSGQKFLGNSEVVCRQCQGRPHPWSDLGADDTPAADPTRLWGDFSPLVCPCLPRLDGPTYRRAVDTLKTRGGPGICINTVLS